ncbi:MAG: GNAT family N-acetyltransferase [Cytophagales bacterium]|nr:GNAT family N-acetyltransferase [Cytophagales bacterium]
MIKIREGNKQDARSIIQFQVNMALETEDLILDRTVVEKGVLAVFSDDRKGSYYVAELNGAVIGALMTTYEWSDWRNGRVIWIQSVFVEKEYRGKGIYRMLYEHVKALVQSDENDFRGIRLYVDKTNTAARKVYEKLGMENHHYEMYEWMHDQ